MPATFARSDLPPYQPPALQGWPRAATISPGDRAARITNVLLRLAADPGLTVRSAIASIALASRACELSPGDLARFLGALPRNVTTLRTHLAERAAAAPGHFAPQLRRTFDAAEVAAILGTPADDALAVEVRAGAALVRGRVAAVLRPGGAGHFALWTVTRAAAHPDVRGAEAVAAFREMVAWTFQHLPCTAIGAHVPAENRPAQMLAAAVGFRLHAATDGFRHYLRRMI